MQAKHELRDAMSTPAPSRLHYLDWLRLLATLMVFLFHAVHPVDFGDWQVKNVEQSEIITIMLELLGLWGMPFFFLVAGAGSWLALQRRSANQYVRERFSRLAIPFVVGTILFSPIEIYAEWANKVQRGVLNVSLRQSVISTLPAPSLRSLITPRWFGYGFHLWFLGFLFSFALITLPCFLWLKTKTGQRLISWMARRCDHRGAILVFAAPTAIAQCLLRPLFPAEHDWADFVVLMLFFALGFLLFADERFARIILRDGRLLFAMGTVIVLGLVGMYLTGVPVVTWGETPGTAQFYVIQFLINAIGVAYSLAMLFVGMRFLNFTNRWLRYGREAALPFFVLHQPVIIVIAFFVVQWDVSLWVKLPVVLLSSFVVSLALYELLVRRFGPLQRAFGMK